MTTSAARFPRRALLCITLVAIVHGLFFIWYQQPDWRTQWSDQDGYRRLAETLATSGKFTRFPDAQPFVPEVLRTPAYPLFLATIYKVFGPGQLPVVLAQTVLFAATCLLVFAIARRLAPESMAVAAAAATALFSPLPYFGALVMTELWTTFVFTVAIWIALRALQSGRVMLFAAGGVMLGVAALSRPIYVLFPFALAAVGCLVIPLVSRRDVDRGNGRPQFGHWVILLAAFAVTMLPWFTYNYLNLGRLTISPAGGMGRALWEGTWQATWSGRLQDELTLIAEANEQDPARVDSLVTAVAARERLSPGPMLEYVHQWHDIRQIWTTPVDPVERVTARVRADAEYFRVGLDNLRHDSAGHLLKRLARGVFILWAGEIPIRYSDINHVPPIVIRAIWGVQALIALLALVGLVALFRAGRSAEACLLGSCILYISAVLFPLFSEARHSLPAQPIVLILATFGVASLTGHSLALESQVHERQHL
jgi:4-amino-4-deoxy-L-arabinose transferase-like glycosyltransferase